MYILKVIFLDPPDRKDLVVCGNAESVWNVYSMFKQMYDGKENAYLTIVDENGIHVDPKSGTKLNRGRNAGVRFIRST